MLGFRERVAADGRRGVGAWRVALARWEAGGHGSGGLGVWRVRGCCASLTELR